MQERKRHREGRDTGGGREMQGERERGREGKEEAGEGEVG